VQFVTLRIDIVNKNGVMHYVRKQVNRVTFFPNKSKLRETFTNFISSSDFRHVLDLIKLRKIKNLRVSFDGVSPMDLL